MQVHLFVANQMLAGTLLPSRAFQRLYAQSRVATIRRRKYASDSLYTAFVARL